MGFLYALLLMCSWMIYGGANYYMTNCNITMEEGKTQIVNMIKSICLTFFVLSVHFHSKVPSIQSLPSVNAIHGLDG